MENTLTYSELQDLCLLKKISIAALTKKIGLTYQGLRSALDRQSLGVKYVAAICNTLQISPNQFFRLPENPIQIGNQVEQNGLVNMQQIQDGMDILRDQLAVKDRQIEILLNLLSK